MFSFLGGGNWLFQYGIFFLINLFFQLIRGLFSGGAQ